MNAIARRNADLKIEVGEKVRVYRETDRFLTGPYPVICVERKQIFILVNNREVQFGLQSAPIRLL